MLRENKTQLANVLAKLQQVRMLVDQCIAELTGTRSEGSRNKSVGSARRRASAATSRSFDFDLNQRAFMKAHASGMSGGEKFALMLAFLAKGDVKGEIKLKDIENHWSKMTALLGDFNRKYSNDAKEDGLVNTKKHGIYVLTAQWRDILISR